MPGSASAHLKRATTPSSRRAAELYDRHGTALYRQAYLPLGDQGQAEQVVCDVVVGECLRPAASPDRRPETGRRLAVAAYWRCREEATPRSGELRPAEAGPDVTVTGCAGLPLRSGHERGTLALVLFGGLRCGQASQELAIPAAELSALLQTAMRHLAGLPASPA